jgi:deoxyribodipyrimidine photo-lyase
VIPKPVFPTKFAEIIQRIESIDPIDYGRTRNYTEGSVTYLSPYISRGVISTRLVADYLRARFSNVGDYEKLLQELAWRDYWQQIWIARKSEINGDLRNTQSPVRSREIPSAIISGNTGIEAIDRAVHIFYETGYLHNHVRMYIAALCCNIGQCHWKNAARWMYYHLLDADWASNALSWQWVAGTNSQKKYIANQENINKYCGTSQTHTFLDKGYEELANCKVPYTLTDTTIPQLITSLPVTETPKFRPGLPVLIYNFYHLDPEWRKSEPANRILLLEPDVFAQYPVSSLAIDFMLKLAENINEIQIFTGTFDELEKFSQGADIFFREHPLNAHYRGTEDPREWIFPVQGEYRSFFAYWKKCLEHLKT